MLKPENINSPESYEKGENIKIDLVIKRHSKYNQATGSLTAEGKALAKNVGQKTKQITEAGNFIIKSVTSTLPRAKETAMEILKGINSQHKDLELGKSEHGDLSIQINNMSSFLEKGQEVSSDGKIISTKILAADKAKDIFYVMEMSKNLPNNFSLQIINITHLPWLLSFLKEVAGQELSRINPKGKTFLEKIGGTIDFTEGLELKIHRLSQTECQLVLNFRGQEVKISEDKIKKLIRV